MIELTYDFSNLEYRTYSGVEEVFQRIRSMMNQLNENETYHHFVGHSDRLWNNMGMPDRSRREIVPVKKSKGIKTIGLYTFSDWLLDKFGGKKASDEKRDMGFLPEGISFPIRFYCYRDVVHYIFEAGQDFTSIEVINLGYADIHKKLVESLRKNTSLAEEHQATVALSGFTNHLYDQIAVCSYILLDLFSRKITSVKVDSTDAKNGLSDLISKSQGIQLEVR